MAKKENREKKSAWHNLVRVLAFLWSDEPNLRIRLFISFVFALFSLLINVSIPLFLKHAVDILSVSSAKHMILIALGAYSFIWSLSMIMIPIRELFVFRVIFYGSRVFVGTLFRHLHTLSQRFHVEKSTGAILNIIERVPRALPDIVWGVFLMIVPVLLEILVSIGILWWMYGFVYGLLLFVMLIVYIVFSYYAIEWSIVSQRKYNEIRKKTSSRIVDSLLNFETVKYFANHDFEFESCNQLLKAEEVAGTERYIRSELVNVGQGIVVGIGFTIFNIISGYAVYHHTHTIGDFIAINSYVLQCMLPLGSFGYVFRRLRESLADLEHVFDLLDQKSEIVDVPFAIDLWVDTPTIEFNHVSFGYDKRRVVLDDISFFVPAGKTVAFVGATGSGKSTIVKLLFRFYDVQAGSIKISGHDIRFVTQKSLQKSIGIVPQETALFNTTLYNNLMYARPTATMDEVNDAIAKAHLKDFIEKQPDGYATMIGERGLKISGGEKQRISIARVLLKEPAIYVFDEATSALDTKTEKQIQKNLEELSIGKTTLIIAHRLSTVTHADIIIVFDKGKIVEQGSHEELLIKDGMYARLWNQQNKIRKKELKDI